VALCHRYPVVGPEATKQGPTPALIFWGSVGDVATRRREGILAAARWGRSGRRNTGNRSHPAFQLTVLALVVPRRPVQRGLTHLSVDLSVSLRNRKLLNHQLKIAFLQVTQRRTHRRLTRVQASFYFNVKDESFYATRNDGSCMQLFRLLDSCIRGIQAS